jgi:hypothetical protein
MSALTYFMLAALTVLSVCLLLLSRGVRPDFDREAFGTGQETSLSLGWDSLTSELSARIFDAEDSDFVASEASRKIAQQFRQERTELAIGWLRALRREVNQSIRTHLKASRRNTDLKPADEISVWFDFLVFQLTGAMLYLVIWVYGPFGAGKLVGSSLKLAGQFRKVTEDVLPAGRQVSVELLDGKTGTT